MAIRKYARAGKRGVSKKTDSTPSLESRLQTAEMAQLQMAADTLYIIYEAVCENRAPDIGVYARELDRVVTLLEAVNADKEQHFFNAYSLLVLARFAMQAEKPPTGGKLTTYPPADAINLARGELNKAVREFARAQS